jgi:NADPH:quinone reductase-like Zn-dependent oxidoreductase
VCSTDNVEFVRSLGADAVVDHTCEDPHGSYDVVLQVAGDTPLRRLRNLAAPQGRIVIVGSGVGRDGKHGLLGPVARIARARLTPRRRGKHVHTFIAKVRRPDLDTLAEIASPHVSRTFSLAETAAALAQVESGHVRGKLAISIT